MEDLAFSKNKYLMDDASEGRKRKRAGLCEETMRFRYGKEAVDV